MSIAAVSLPAVAVPDMQVMDSLHLMSQQWQSHSVYGSATQRRSQPPPTPAKKRVSSRREHHDREAHLPTQPRVVAVVNHHALQSVSLKDLVEGTLLGKGDYGAVTAVSLRESSTIITSQPSLALKRRVLKDQEVHSRVFATTLTYLRQRICDLFSATASPHAPSSLTRHYKVWFEAGALYTLMDRCHGVSLEKWLLRTASASRRAFTPELAWLLVSEIGEALHFLHTHQLLFNDLKPENIGITEHLDGSCSFMLLDFDSITCTRADSDWRARETDGRDGRFEAPEHELHAPSDIFSLGRTVLALFDYEERLFGTSMDAEEDTFERIRVLDVHLAHVLKQMTEMDPLLRPQL